MKDMFWMKRALLLANKAYYSKNVPIGAVLVFNDFEIGSSFNYSGLNYCSFYHAELIALKQGSFYISNYFFMDVNLYVTLKPCSMCISYCFFSKIKNIFFMLDNNKVYNYKKNILSINNDLLKNKSIFLLKKFFKKNKNLII